MTDADSTECAPDTPTKVIYKLRDLLGVDDLGGTMRLGSYACQLKQGSLSQRLYGADVIHERHRHRYEFNCLYEQTLTDKGLQIVGRSLDGKFVEIVELPDAPLVRRGAVPPRVQEQAAPAAPAVRRLRRGVVPPQGGGAGRRRLGGTGAGNEYNQRVNIAPVAIGPLTLGAPAPLLFIGGPVRHREPVARPRPRPRDPGDRARGRGAVRLQGVVRQGQPDLDRLVSRARAWPRACARSSG